MYRHCANSYGIMRIAGALGAASSGLKHRSLGDSTAILLYEKQNRRLVVIGIQPMSLPLARQIRLEQVMSLSLTATPDWPAANLP